MRSTSLLLKIATILRVHINPVGGAACTVVCLSMFTQEMTKKKDLKPLLGFCTATIPRHAHYREVVLLGFHSRVISTPTLLRASSLLQLPHESPLLASAGGSLSLTQSSLNFVSTSSVKSQFRVYSLSLLHQQR
jgi:hypothetical protein